MQIKLDDFDMDKSTQYAWVWERVIARPNNKRNVRQAVTHIYNKWLWISRRRRCLHEIHLKIYILNAFFGAIFFYDLLVGLSFSLWTPQIHVANGNECVLLRYEYNTKRSAVTQTVVCVNVTNVIDCLFSGREVQWFSVNVEVLLHTLYFFVWTFFRLFVRCCRVLAAILHINIFKRWWSYSIPIHFSTPFCCYDVLVYSI